MENRRDLSSILPFLPLELESGALVWPIRVTEALEALSKGSDYSRVDSGEVLSVAISDLRTSLSLPFSSSPAVANGYALFFDQLLSREESARWFGEVIPVMSNSLLRLPMLLESHYQDANKLFGVETGLRLLESQQPGIVILNQELIAALLSCSFFCLFPTGERGSKCLPLINFDLLFRSLYERHTENLKHKIKCIIHYFERVCTSMPTGSVSFERKILPLEKSQNITYPDAEFWGKSLLPLSPFEVCRSGLIEDHLGGALEVDFANKFLGGGALRRGCVQEEIRFMIYPELIAGMLFLPSMSDNEAIEIVGAERYSDYTGYSSTFHFSGDYVDKSEMDSIGRHKTRIVAIDAVCRPGKRQYEVDFLLREMNKAFCGFLDQLKHQHHQISENDSIHKVQLHIDVKGVNDAYEDQGTPHGATKYRKLENHETSDQRVEINKLLDCYGKTGVATGNWGCGAYGGDPEVKAVIQWIAASQASRSFITYYTFELADLENLDQVTQWILSQEWTVGELWNILLEYCSKRVKRETEAGFFSWLLPSSPMQE